MTFKDWQDTADAGQLMLPIRGREYVIPELGYLDAIRLKEETDRIRDGGPSAATMQSEEWLTLLLGDTLQQMRGDNVPRSAIVKAAAVAHMDAVNGRGAAEQLWNEGPDPEALAAALKAAADSITSQDTAAAASSTRKRASTSGTTSRRTATKSPGRKSSTSLA